MWIVCATGGIWIKTIGIFNEELVEYRILQCFNVMEDIVIYIEPQFLKLISYDVIGIIKFKQIDNFVCCSTLHFETN